MNPVVKNKLEDLVVALAELGECLSPNQERTDVASVVLELQVFCRIVHALAWYGFQPSFDPPGMEIVISTAPVAATTGGFSRADLRYIKRKPKKLTPPPGWALRVAEQVGTPGVAPPQNLSVFPGVYWEGISGAHHQGDVLITSRDPNNAVSTPMFSQVIEVIECKAYGVSSEGPRAVGVSVARELGGLGLEIPGEASVLLVSAHGLSRGAGIYADVHLDPGAVESDVWA